MAWFANKEKETYCGNYRGIDVYQYGCMIGNNWYGDFYCKHRKNGRNYKVKDSVCRSIQVLKDYIDKHYDELKEV